MRSTIEVCRRRTPRCGAVSDGAAARRPDAGASSDRVELDTADDAGEEVAR